MPAATGFQRTLVRLMRTPNQSAATVLEAGVTGPSAEVRNGSIAAWARRSDEPSQRAFLTLFHQLTSSEVDALRDLPRNFRGTLRKVLREHDPELCMAACDLILRCRAFDEFPALVESAANPEHPGGDDLAATALQLACDLHDEVVRYRDQPSGRDPSFARRWALTALVKAVDRFVEHRRIELVDAFLLVTPADNHTLKRLLNDSTHSCHEPLMKALRTSRSGGAVELLAAMFEDPQTPLPLLEITAQRDDPFFRTTFLEALGHPMSPRAAESAGRLGKIAWLEKSSDDWFDLPGEQQATALQLASATRQSRHAKLALVEHFLTRAAPVARRIACDCLAKIDLPSAIERLESLLTDGDPQVVAAAAQKLRKKGYTGAVPHLARLLEHGDATVRGIAQSALRDFTFMRYLGEFDDLEESARNELGRIVARTDSTSQEKLVTELKAATPGRKSRALQMSAAMDLVDELLEEVLSLAEHQDAEIRSEAIAALPQSRDERAREAIQSGACDQNATVANRAAAALAAVGASGLGEGDAT